ncbi:MAG TPA: methyltransferase domain-containing protein [Caulobacteraceae bacterium]|nr:methyltransferase domain-containing protein [Caulobacteraceae bacterium]
MRRDVLDLREFYAGALGRAAREMVSRKVAEAWGSLSGLDLLALGYATPFLERLTAAARRTIAAMPAAQGVEAWPLGAPNCAALVDEAALPFQNALFDRVLAVHALEESESPIALLREVGRVLAPSGRLIVAVAARHGLWAEFEATPFGHGRPFSRRQLGELIREADLEPAGWTRALYAPPLGWAGRWAEGFEHAGAVLWPPFAGVILMEAVKQTFAIKPRARKARARVFAPGALNPAGAASRDRPRDQGRPSLGAARNSPSLLATSRESLHR